MRYVPLALTMLALVAAPIAAAEDANETPERPDDAAWVDDCPPDMMCAYDESPGRFGPDDCIDCMQPPADDEPTRGPADGSCEHCRGDETPSNGETCMDGADAGEACDDDVMYFGDGPADSGPIDSYADDESATHAVPGTTFALVVVAAALAIFLLARRS